MCRSACEGFIDVTGQSVARRPVSAYRKQVTSDWHVEPKGLIIVASYMGVPRQDQPETCGCTGQVNNLGSPKTDVGRDSSVGIATCYGLDGLGIASRWGRDFPNPSRLALGPIQPPTQWVPDLSQGQSGRDVELSTHPHLALRLRKE